MSITEKAVFSPKEVVQIIVLVVSVAGSYLASTYNMNVRFNELVASNDKIYIYLDQMHKDGEIQDMRIQSAELGIRKNEVDIAVLKGK
ncbi:MAG: hypothetical protein ACRDE7_00085 [Sphingobacterium sp.]